MINARTNLFRMFRAHYIAAFVMVAQCIMANEKPQEQWQTGENLVTRLGGEWYKIGVLKKELQSMQEILQDLRDIELFPVEVTRASEEALVLFDKKIETLSKKHFTLVEQVDGLRPPLIDAMAILREMVTGRPVEEMFTVIDNDDIRRISTMFTVKHHIDSLWRNFDGAFAVLAEMAHTGLPEKEEPQGFGDEFFEILKANLGQLPERYYRILNAVKDTLFKRGDDDLRGRMFQVEAHRIKLYLKTGNAALAKMKLSGIRARYAQGRFADECNLLFLQACFALGNFEEALQTIALLPPGMASAVEIVLDKAQSLFLLKRYDDLWNWASKYDYASLTGSARNVMLWLAMESGLALGKKENSTVLASQVVKDSSYALHVMHCMGRYYVTIGDWTTAQSVFESALRLVPPRKIDQEASQRIVLTLAQTYYQRGDYRKALSLFFDLLKQEACFAEALYGISWCYLGLGDDEKAETSLRKLINQDPQSPLSVQALLIIMQRYRAKAGFEWEKYCYLATEEQRLADRRAIVEKTAADTGNRHAEDYRRLAAKIDELLLRLKKENRCSYDEIASYFDKAAQTAHLIDAYYATGTFQESSFSEKREKLLRRLDSMLLCVKDPGGAAAKPDAMLLQSKREAAETKRCVQKSGVAAVEALIDQYRWEREYVEWQKTAVKRAKDDNERKQQSAAIAMEGRRLDARMDSLVKAGDEVNKKWHGLLIKKCNDILALPLDASDEAYLRYHLGEASYTFENENYAVAYASFEDSLSVFDSLMALYHEGKVLQQPARPREPALNHDVSAEQFRTVLKKYPSDPLAHAVHYSLAWCFNDQGLFDSAVAHMHILADNYPSSQYAPQAWMYLGEYMFDHAKLDRALKAYQAVMKYPESEWFDKALYKLAWTQYRLSNPEKAIGSFLALVDLGEGNRTGKTLLEKESIDYIAISFSETDVTGEKGLVRATNFVRRFGDPSKGAQILHRLATIFKEQGRFDMAQKTYATLLRTYPENQNSPLIESELLAVLEKNSSIEEANIGRVQFFNKYNKMSAWARAQSDPAVAQRGDSLACQLLYDVAISYHQLALQKNDTALYTTAADNYQTFIQNYPASTHAGECHYNYAEILFSLGNYQKAAEEYITVSKRYPDSKYRETAAWNAIVASQNLLKKESVTVR